LIVLIANAHPALTPRTVLAQKDQLLEIGSGARLGRPIICGRLSVSRDKPLSSAHDPVRKVSQLSPIMPGKWSPNKSSLYDVIQNRRKARSSPQTFFSLRMTFSAHTAASTPQHPLDTKNGGAGRDRTDDPLLAKQVLSQLSYGP